MWLNRAGGGSYGPQGISHNTSGDIAIIDLPNISFQPGSPIEVERVWDYI